MAFNKDQSPSSLGAGQKEPKGLFTRMRQGVMRTIHPPNGLKDEMHQGKARHSYPENAPKVGTRMKQGG